MVTIGMETKPEATEPGGAVGAPVVTRGRRPRVLMIGRGDPKHLITWFHLARGGLTVLSAENALDAAEMLGMLRRRDHEPDLIVIDTRVHPREAIAAAKVIRGSQYIGPMLGLVRRADGAIARRCFAAGCNRCTNALIAPEQVGGLLRHARESQTAAF